MTTHKIGNVDLTTCDTEPIHLIGAIQPHGALLAARATTFEVTHVSANIARYLNISDHMSLLGTALPDLLGNDQFSELLTLPLEPSTPELFRPWFVTLNTGADGAVELECLPHRYADHFILELLRPENSPSEIWEQDKLRQAVISELVRPAKLDELAQVSAELVRMVTGFDRVMIYRFAHDKHGEVIAESTCREDSFLGLHYPASDIPEPARRHFFLNVVRAIPDINATPSLLVTSSSENTASSAAPSIDLTYSKLRAVSPVHVEYLNNMGVGATMSISLTTQDQLWGLVACHHYSPKHISTSRIRFAELLGATISSLLQSLENTSQLQKSILAEKVSFGMEMEARGDHSLIDVISKNSAPLFDLFQAHGLIVKIGSSVRSIGNVPNSPISFSPMRTIVQDGIATSSNLSSVLTMNSNQQKQAAGAAYMELSDDGEDYLVLLREHFEQTIKWAGKPEKIERKSDDGIVRLTPRGSFALWREERLGHSKPFDESDMEALRIVRRALFALSSLERERTAVQLQKDAEAEQARLQLALLDALRKSSMGELASVLAHEMNQPLAAVTNYVNASRQELKNAGLLIEQSISDLMDNAVSESARAADLIRRLRNFVFQGDLATEHIDLHEVIRESVGLALAPTHDIALQVELDFEPALPKIWADPVQIGLVVLNLSRNSITAMDNTKERKLKLSTKIRDQFVLVSVRDTGRGIPDELHETLFEPFHSSTTHGMGIGLSLCRSIIQAHSGRIWADTMNNGTEIVFSLPLKNGNND